MTHDPRFVLAKPAIGHFAIGLIMLKRGWMLRYMPPIVTETIPEYVTFAGYAWAALCFVLGAGTIAVAMTGDMKLWTFYVTVVLLGAKIAAFAVQYVAFRLLVGSRIRAAARALKKYASKQQGWACAARWVIPPPGELRTIPVSREMYWGDQDGRGRKLEYRHDHADGRAQGDADLVEPLAAR